MLHTSHTLLDRIDTETQSPQTMALHSDQDMFTRSQTLSEPSIPILTITALTTNKNCHRGFKHHLSRGMK